MTRRLLASSMVVGLVLSFGGCADESDPFAAGADAGAGDVGRPDAAPGAADGGDSSGAPRTCAPPPARVIVLGDSITDCTVIGGPDSADCVSKQFFDYVKGHYGPDAIYENVAVGGAQTAGLTQQLANIDGGPGPVLVMVYVGGNDLSPYIFQSDASAVSAFDQIMPGVVGKWQELFAFFEDTSRFPGGATIVMNNQYNPFDDCTASPYNLSATKSNLLHMFNAVLVDLANEHHAHALIVDQFTPFLGHGHHFDVATCPHYQAGAAGYMKDLIHANAEGNRALAAVMNQGADLAYRDCE